jgi:hypothetical protein
MGKQSTIVAKEYGHGQRIFSRQISPEEQLLAMYQKLHDGLSDMIEGGRLNESDIPDDYKWLVDSLEAIAIKENA